MKPRVILLATANSYRSEDFTAAAERLGIDLVTVMDVPSALDEPWQRGHGVDFGDTENAVAALLALNNGGGPVQAVLAVDDRGSLLAAQANRALGRPHNDPGAAEAARDKFRMRTLLAQAGVPSPHFRRHSTVEDPQSIASISRYPCVIKPLTRSGSQGVMRADDGAELVVAVERLKRVLRHAGAGRGPWPFLVEEYIPGAEVALEGLLHDGKLHVLALFDKPDPLVGPFFEETIYVTPSRLPRRLQGEIAACAQAAAEALGLQHGPVHAELRLNARGPWIVEVAGRSIGGLCARALRFGVDVSLEELILRQAAGLELPALERERAARGVMMIPIPERGLLRGVAGAETARAVPGVTEVTITAPLHNEIVPLPEGDSYLGFIFAQGETPEEAEGALREAHGLLRFEIEPVLALRGARRDKG